ncbi:MAG: DUF2157 domain-containing protein [Rhodospirillaceae bacterium]|nr:DUF2157 domain-containing protein [Rhodospirillaceae bacterium]
MTINQSDVSPAVFGGFSPQAPLLARWIAGLNQAGILSSEQSQAARRHFGLDPSSHQWRTFLFAASTLAAALLIAAGLILFFAWNWEAMPKAAKFALAETVFVLFALIALWKWRGPVGHAALMGTGLAIGALLALFGQIYQTGADSWELFRAWTLVLLPLALLAGNRTGLWFMTLAVADLWAGLWLWGDVIEPRGAIWFPPLALEIIAAHAVLWTLAEIAHNRTRTAPRPFDPHRALARILGAVTLTAMTIRLLALILANSWVGGSFLNLAYLYSGPASPLSGIGVDASRTDVIAAAFLFGVTFLIYARRRGDFFFVALIVALLAILFDTALIRSLVEQSHDIIPLSLLAGIIIVATCLGVTALILKLRRRLPSGRTAEGEIPVPSGVSPLRSSLTDWLTVSAGIEAAPVADWFSGWDRTAAERQPWYVKSFISAGIWLGSLLLISGVIGLLFAGLSGIVPQVVLGLIIYAAGIFLRRNGGNWARLNLSLVLIVCGLVLVGYLLSEDVSTGLLLYAALFLAGWCVLKDRAGKAFAFAAFLAALTILALYHDHSAFDADGDVAVTSFTGVLFHALKAGYRPLSLLCWTGFLLFTLLEFTAPPPLKPHWFEAERRSAAAGFLLFAAGLTIAATIWAGFDHSGSGMVLLTLVPWAGALAGLAIAAAILALRHPRHATRIAVAGLLLIGLAVLSFPVLLGVLLLLLARRRAAPWLGGIATLYLVFFVQRFYYALDVSLLDKSLILIGSGLILALAAAGFRQGWLLNLVPEKGDTP